MFLRKLVLLLCVVFFMSMSASAFADDDKKDMLFIVTSPDAQTQMMAMVLSTQSMKKGAKVSVLLCGPGGDLALKGNKGTMFKPINKSPEMLLKGLIKKGVSVQVCPLYLPAKGMKMDALVDGITKAKPPVVAGEMIDEDTEVVTF